MATTEGWFLAGNPNVPRFNLGLKKLFHNMILKREFYSPVNPRFLSYLFFYIDSDDWKIVFPDVFDIRIPLPVHRIHFTCSSVLLDWKENIPEGYRLLHVDTTLDIASLEIPKDINEWIEYYLDYQLTLGFGMCLVHGNKIVVWVNPDCASGNECEIGIITTEEYRLKGLGALTAAAAVEYCFSRGYSIVGWHCEEENYGSIGVAKKVGFHTEREYIQYICMFNEAEHFAEKGMRHFYDKEYDEAIASFEQAFEIDDVPTWAYILAARSYATKKDVKTVVKYLERAYQYGWENWPPVIKSEELTSINEDKHFREFLKLLDVNDYL